MLRRLAIVATLLLLAGCVTQREIVYRDRYWHDDGYAAARYEDRYEDRYAGDGSYYAAPESGRGDYYYRAAPRAYSSFYWDYPAYASVFWPLYRSWYDPFWYPGYYYGVTYFPRNYFSISLHGGWRGGGWGWPGHGHLYYSPYRYSWVDNYYDWSPWSGHRHRRHETPRFGSARNEAERLARMGEFSRARSAGPSAQGRGPSAIDSYGRARDGRRGADYTGVPAPREAPGFRGFGVRQPAQDVRRVGTEAYAPRGDARAARGGWSADRPGSTARDEAVRWQGTAPERDARYERAAPEQGVYVGPAPRRSGRGATYEPQPRATAEYASPAPRGYGEVRRGGGRGYDVGGQLPAPRYEARPAPQYEASREARFEARPEPRYESRPEPRYEAPAPSHSRSDEGRSRDSDGGVRRVGSQRED